MAPGTFCATHEKHLFERRAPHHARTAQHGADQHAERNEYMLIDPKIMHWRPETSKMWPWECMLQCRPLRSPHDGVSGTQKRVAPSASPPSPAPPCNTTPCRIECRLSTLRTHSARAKAVRSGCVSGIGRERARTAWLGHATQCRAKLARGRGNETRFEIGFQL